MLEMERCSENKEMSFRPKVLVSLSSEMRDGLIDEAHMEGLIMHKCSGREIDHCNAFMVATRKKAGSPIEKYYKIQNKVFFKAFSVICNESKGFCTDEECKVNDATAAEFLLEEDIREQKKYKSIKDIQVLENEDKTRQGIRYICPLTRLDEIAFPVKLFEREMGVLIVGQISLPEHRGELETYIKRELAKTEKTRQDAHCKNESECIFDRIEEENLGELTEKICQTVTDIEEGLIDYYKERQNQYVLEKSNELINNLKKTVELLKQEFPTSPSLKLVYPGVVHAEQYKAIVGYIREQLEVLCKTINAKRKEIFVSGFVNLADDNYDSIKNERFEFRYAEWVRDREGEKICCVDLKKYIPGIDDEFDLLLVADAPTYPIAMALCSRDFLCGVEGQEKELLQWTVCETFSKFAEYAQMLGLESKSDYYRVFLDNYMSIQRHELGQSNAGYEMLIEEFKRHRNQLQKQLEGMETSTKRGSYVHTYLKQCDNFIQDSGTYLYTTMIRIQASKYLIDFSKMKKMYFYPYDTFLFKWKIIYEKKVREADLKFHFPEVKLWDITRPRMYGDSLMIEQVAYNLTNNAIKYALRGTEISMDCCLSEDQKHYEIIVENYGNPFEDSSEVDGIFDFGSRGSNNEKEGSGLGLYLSKQIALAHDGDLTCEVEELSKYNWTLIRQYMDIYEMESNVQFCNDKVLYQKLKMEWEERKAEILQCNKIVLINNAFTPMYVQQNIRKGTAKFKFTFWIPYDGE